MYVNYTIERPGASRRHYQYGPCTSEADAMAHLRDIETYEYVSGCGIVEGRIHVRELITSHPTTMD